MLLDSGPARRGCSLPMPPRRLAASEAVVGYRGYLDLIEDRLAGKTIVGRELGEEVERARWPSNWPSRAERSP